MSIIGSYSGLSFGKTQTLREIAASADSKYILIYTGNHRLEMGMFACERIVGIADDTRADMLYADHYRLVMDSEGNEVRRRHPLIDCQKGALRNDFDFGNVLVFRTESFKKAVSEMTQDYEYAALYDLRLRMDKIVHINEYLYTDVETDNRKSGEKQFDYVDPRNRAVQIEMEKVCTEHLKRIGHISSRSSRNRVHAGSAATSL